MRFLLNWAAAAASLLGLYFTLLPKEGDLTTKQITIIFIVVIVFAVAAFIDIRAELRRSAKSYKTQAKINKYMLTMLENSGRCEICSRDASWITDPSIYKILQSKSKKGELTFLVHKSTPEIDDLAKSGAEVIEYGAIGFDPITRFTVVNAGNKAASYVAIGRKRPHEPHTIEEVDSTHPTYSLAIDLIGSIRIAHAKHKAK
jgi:hypothetical protein